MGILESSIKLSAWALVMTFTPFSLSATALIQNGNFNKGNIGFDSDYLYKQGGAGIFTLPGNYGITKNPNSSSRTGYANDYISMGDHTNGRGYMLLFDGKASGEIWRQTVTLQANKTYNFSYFATTPDVGELSGSDLADIEFRVNGAAIGGAVITSQGGDPWQSLIYSFRTDAAGTYTVSLADLNGAGGANDDLIDDISLKAAKRIQNNDARAMVSHAVLEQPMLRGQPMRLAGSPPSVPEPTGWALMLLGLGTVGGALRRRRATVGVA